MQRRCAVSGAQFEIAPEDLRFYERMKVPPPTLCPEERQRRRLAWRNERRLYRRTCSATGKSVISLHHADVPFPVYSHGYWWSDAWDPRSYGREVDFSRPFFEQYRDLQNAVPRSSMLNGANENSDYVNLSSWNKNCYLLFESDSNRDCLYLDHSFFNTDSLDLSYTTKSELCYECLYCNQCYGSSFLENCENCSGSSFLKSCIGCNDCFGCVNLRNKRSFLWNQPSTVEEVEAERKKLVGLSFEELSALTERFAVHARKYPVRAYEGYRNEEVSGNYIWESKNCHFCFDCRADRDCKWVCNCVNSNDCYDIDVYGGDRGMELVYEGHSVGNGVFQSAFNTCLFEEVYDSFYCDFCHFSANLFGCIGLRHCEHCILNKQYSEAEYFATRNRLIEMMTRTGEWGEFFPIALSPFGYNESVAQEYYPLTREEAATRGFHWRDEKPEARPAPDAVRCRSCGVPFRYQEMELGLYQRQGLPRPLLCLECRYQARMKKRLPRRLYERACPVTGERFLSPFAPDRPERVLSPDAFEKEF